jgi:hypothetical protein
MEPRCNVPGLALRDLSDAVIRATPGYVFLPFEKLSQDQISSLGPNAAASGFAGVLIHSGFSKLRMKAVSARTSALFERIRTPTTVGAVLREMPPQNRAEVIADLVLEGVFEVEVDGTFVGQLRAYGFLVEDDSTLVGASRIAALSVSAVKHAGRLEIDDAQMLAPRLYFYNRVPVNSWAVSLWPNAEAVLRFLDADRPQFDHLRERFAMSFSDWPNEWITWRRRAPQCPPTSDVQRLKLYVSPAVQDMKVALSETLAVLPASGATAFKIGPHAHGLLRPDKCVVYFDTREQLFALVDALRPRLAGLCAQGVPFTAPIDDEGILSWGTDPPPEWGQIGWHADDSWRLWICNRLASALISGARENNSHASWRFALTKLWLSGVDTRDWTLQPTPDAWVG